MKKYVIIILVIVGFFAFMKAKEWYNNNQIERSELLQETLRLQRTMREDSLTIYTQTTVIKNGATIISSQSKNIQDLRKKFNTKTDSYIKLKAELDSIKADKDTTYVTPDSTDSTVFNFEETLGDGWFEVYGKIHTNPVYVFGLGMHQIMPIIIEVSIEKIPGGKDYVTYTYVNYPELEISTTPIKIIDNERWIDKLSFTAHMSLLKFGVGVGLMYNNIGLSYMQFVDSPALMINYSKNIGEIF